MRKPSRPRSRFSHGRLLRVMLPLFLFLFGCFTPEPPPRPGPGADEANIAILGDASRLAPGSQASFLVQVRAPYTRQRWPDAPVEVYLNAPDGSSRQVFSGATGTDGIAEVRFPVPDEPAAGQVLEIVSTIPPAKEGEYDPYAGEYRTYQDVYIGRAYNVLVSTDKPVYQPGQVIHLRGLALDSLDLHAADAQTMTLTVADPQGNKLMQKELATSAYGIASADFPLDSQAPSGDYTITAALGPTESSRTVEVKPYNLPRFEVTFLPDKTFYLPGETATGAVEARYFFGKPVAGAAVSIRGTLDLGDGETTVVELTGETDVEGRYAYSFAVPADFGGRLDNHSVDIDLEISVTDTANHVETVDDSISVAEKPLLIDAVPESGRLREGIDDLVYLDVSYPDGVAAQATLTITDEFSQTFVATTDAYGLAVITLTTPHTGLTPLRVTADDGRGHVVEQPLLLGSDTSDSTASVLLRPEHTESRIGDTLNVDIFVAAKSGSTGWADTVYLDIIKDRQTFGLAVLPVVDGMAQAAIPIDGSLLGTLELNAYVVDDAGQLASDRRYVLVNPAPANVTVTADQEVYRPGDTATLDIQVDRSDLSGIPLPAAVGVSIVDESVFAVEDQDPGFARTYFLLNRELQESRYGLHGFVDLESDDPSPYDDTPDSVRYADSSARQIALTGALAQVLADETSDETSYGENVPGTNNNVPGTGVTLVSLWGNRIYLAAPLLGLALYDGSRKRRRLLIALVVFSLGAFVWSACAAPAAAPAAEQAAIPAADEGATTATRGEKPPRLRQFFPETLFWLPELVTDEQGRAQIEVPIADSITTWRASLLVSDQQGNLGSSEIPLRVFQDFFVEPDLPRFLTVGDEIDAPVAIYNYLPQTQTITLTVTPADWFELRSEPQLRFEAGPNAVLAAYIPLRVTKFGVNNLEITAAGSEMSDAVRREVEVLPDGQHATDVTGGRLAAGEQVTASAQVTLPIPPAAVPGAGRVTVKIYGGVVSQVLEGLEGLLQMPYGCFEQTSSATYPNVLILDYLRRSGQTDGAIELQAQNLISLGYQRLISFEVPGEPGGFSLFGDPPPDTMLTAYGLLEFSDMGEVAYVDPDLLARVVTFLTERQNRDGSWTPANLYSVDNSVTLDSSLAATAYIAWGLADAGHADGSAVRQAVRYLQENLDVLDQSAGAGKATVGTGAPPPDDNAGPRATVEAAAGMQPYSPLLTPRLAEAPHLSNYTLALIANALVAAGEDATPVLNELINRAQMQDGAPYWEAGEETYLGSYGNAAAIETTALAAQALLRSERHNIMGRWALDYLVAHRDARGSFYTTQATVQALKALLLAAGSEEGKTARVTVRYQRADGTVADQTFTVDDSNADLVQQVSFDDAAPGAQISLEVEGDRTLQYQVVSDFYLPWEAALARAEASTEDGAGAGQPMRIDVTYDRTELLVGEVLNARAEVELLGADAGTLIVELGIPPGFAPLTEDLDDLVQARQIERYELTPRRIVLYLTNAESGQVYAFDYRLQARYPLSAQTAPSEAYNYYTPDQWASEPPQRITVTLGTAP